MGKNVSAMGRRVCDLEKEAKANARFGGVGYFMVYTLVLELGILGYGFLVTFI